MSRARVIIGWIVLILVFFGWNMLFPDTHYAAENGYDRAVLIPTSPLHLGTPWLIAALLLWYGINWINIVNQWERRPVMLFGKYVRTLGPGISFLEPIAYTALRDVSIQDIVVVVVAPNLQTKDNVPIGFTGVLTFAVREDRIKDLVVNVAYWREALDQRTLSTMTDATASTDLNSLLEHREQFSKDLVTKLAERVKTWGIEAKALEIRDFKINDTEIEQALALKARATKEGEAEITRAGMQLQVAQKLNEAAEAYTVAGWRLKSLEVLTELGRSGSNNTLMIPTELTDLFSKISSFLEPKGVAPVAETVRATPEATPE